MSVITVGVRLMADALLTKMSMPPNLLTVSSTAAFTCSSNLISQQMASAEPPAFSTSSAAV